MKKKTFNTLYHVGSMNPTHKGIQGPSHEGHGLSVSECPEDWKRIARLGGAPTWQLTKSNNTFLDAHQLTDDERQTIHAYGLTEGWVTPDVRWGASYFDADYEDWFISYHDTQEEAEREVADYDEEDRKVEAQEVLLATPKLEAYSGFKLEVIGARQMLLVVYADKVLGWDGVFWEDLYMPCALSAPRAVILPERLPEWTIEKHCD